MSTRGARRIPDAATIVSLVLYASLCSLVAVTCLAASGALDRPPLSLSDTALPEYMRNTTLGFYDKSELRLALFLMVAFSVVLASALIAVWARRPRTARLHPATAAFAIVLYFASVVLPPYETSFNHWLPMVSAATGIRNGVWPYFSGYDSGYGLLAPAALALWLEAFGLSDLSLNALIGACTLVSGWAMFVLIRKLTGSRTVALLGAGYLVLEATAPMVVVSTYRAPVQLALGGLLLYQSLRDGNRAIAAGFLFGVLALWAPSFGAFAVAGFACAHGYRIWKAKRAGRGIAVAPLLAMLGGLLLPLAAIGLVTTHAGLRNAAGSLGSATSLFVLGYGNVAQRYDLVIIPGFLTVVLYVALVFRRLLRKRALTRRDLFAGASLIAAAPWVMYAMARSDALHYFAAWWALMPCLALLAWGFVRLVALGPDSGRFTRPARLSVTALLVFLIVFFPHYRVNELAASYLTSYESGREAWYVACAAGKACDPRRKVSLTNHLRTAALPLAVDRMGYDAALVEACRRNVAILSYVDAWVYATGSCFAPTGMPTVNLINTREELDRYVATLAAQPLVVFDTEPHVYAQWKGEMLDEIRKRLVALGFVETRGCGKFRILSRTKPDGLLAKLCPSPAPTPPP